MQNLCSLLLMISIFLQSGCATGPIYQPKAVSLQDGAEIRPSICERRISRVFKLCDVPDVTIVKIDGIRAWPWSSSHLHPLQIVDPGERTITVSGSIATDVAVVSTYEAEAELRVTFKAGHAYLIHGEWLRPVMSFWIEDKTTGEIVSEKQSVGAKHQMHWMNLIPRK